MLAFSDRRRTQGHSGTEQRLGIFNEFRRAIAMVAAEVIPFEFSLELVG